jgi:acyl carrier protein
VDGSLEFIGRIDNQVKVRGYRIELDEVDSALMRVSGVAQAAAVVRKDAHGTNVLYGYYTAATHLTPGDVREALAETVPDFMIPSHLICLDDMPLTNSDKVDRVALTARSHDEPAAHTESGRPALGDEMTERIHAIVVSVLGSPLPDGGSLVPLQLLGVDSLKFMKIVVELESGFGLEFDDDFLLDGRSMSVVEMARFVEARLAGCVSG